MPFYILYYSNGSYSEAMQALKSKAVFNGLTYVLINKPYLLPNGLKKYRAGLLNKNLFAVAYSTSYFSREEFAARISPNIIVEIQDLELPDEEAFYDAKRWFDEHIEFIPKKGLKRVRVEDPELAFERSKKSREQWLLDDILDQWRDIYLDIFKLVLHQMVDQYAVEVCSIQNNWILTHKQLLYRRSKLMYNMGRLNMEGMKAYNQYCSEVREAARELSERMRILSYEFSSKLYREYKKRSREFNIENDNNPDFIPFDPDCHVEFMRYIENEWPKYNNPKTHWIDFRDIQRIEQVLIARGPDFDNIQLQKKQKQAAAAIIVPPFKKHF